MRVIEIASFGPPDMLRMVERPVPQIEPDEVLIKVEAAGVSRADVLQRKGKYAPPPGASDIPGLEVAGTIEEVGAEAHGFQRGDRVCALLAGGGYAEYCAAPAVQVLPNPDGWSAAEAATLPENLFTVYENLINRAHLASGEELLVHGGTSGIGSMAIMLARAVHAKAYATAGSDEKCAACRTLGAVNAVNYKKSDFMTAVMEWTDNRGVDVVLDIVGGPYLDRNVGALAVEGRIALIATMRGTSGTLPIDRLMAKRGTIFASTLRSRTPAQKGAIADQLKQDIWPLLPAKNPILPVIDKMFLLNQAQQAHERLEKGDHVGKIVLVV